MFVEGDLNFRFDDETPSVNEHASPMNPSSQNYGHDRYHWGFEYKIVPLVHNLSQKGNDRELIKHNQNLYANEINIFDEVVGKAYKDDKEHTGLVTYITYKDGGLTPKYVWIIDSDDRQRYALYPKSCKIKDAKRAIKQNRFSPFTTNAYLSESVDLFADGDKYKYHENGEDEAYRLTFINLGINDMYLKAFDKMFIE